MVISRLLYSGVLAAGLVACTSPTPPAAPPAPQSYTDANGVIVTKVSNADEAAAAPIGRLIFIDPATGEQRDPTAAELDAIQRAQAKAAVPGQRPRLQTFETKDGTIGMKLSREYWHEQQLTVDQNSGQATDGGADAARSGQ